MSVQSAKDAAFWGGFTVGALIGAWLFWAFSPWLGR